MRRLTTVGQACTWVANAKLQDSTTPRYYLATLILLASCDGASDPASVDDVSFRSASELGYIPLARLMGMGDVEGNDAVDIVVGDPAAGAMCATGEIEVSYDGFGGMIVPETWDRDTSGVSGSAACGSKFGEAVALGDFNGDGYSDVAIGVPGDTISSNANAGSVHVLYGTSSGLAASGDQIFSQDTSGMSDSAEAYDAFGTAVAAGDFNCDGYGDLAIGVPGESPVGISTPNAGAVAILFGSASGLTTSGNQFIHQALSAIADSSESGDYFGSFLAGGNIDGDSESGNGCDDLAIGIPGEDLPDTSSTNQEDAGAVAVMYGSSSGLDDGSDQLWHQGSSGIPDNNESRDQFGFGLSLVDDNSDGYLDLLVYAPGEDLMFVIYGTSSGLTSTSSSVNAPPQEGFLEAACVIVCNLLCPPGQVCDCASWCTVVQAPSTPCSGCA